MMGSMGKIYEHPHDAFLPPVPKRFTNKSLNTLERYAIRENAHFFDVFRENYKKRTML